mmetsp:Transcript_22109/g.71200  ORF Transcript_22109/g.71200 Transcript_22109/m.71200 type:complete len:136 (+) Transcript_22109:325-732(+)
MLVFVPSFLPSFVRSPSNELHVILCRRYAVILVALHVLFLVIYFWRVPFRELDSNWRSLVARLLGLAASVYLLWIVAGSLPANLGLLAIDLLGLCCVHTLILLLLTVKVESGAPKNVVETQLPPHAINDDGAILA